MLLGLMVTATAEDAETALKRYEMLKQNSAKLKPSSTEAEVRATLGNPVEQRIAGWGPLLIETNLWTYLDFTDDSHHFWFQVTLDRKKGCSISETKTLRYEVSKLPKQVLAGTIIDVFPTGFDAQPVTGFCCSVRFDNGEVKYASASNLTRVTGRPGRGDRIRIEFYGSPPNLIFERAGTPYLESVRFTRADDK